MQWSLICAIGQVYDPLANIGFYNPKEEHCVAKKLQREHVGKMYIPAECSQRSLFCYLRDEDSECDTRRVVEVHSSCVSLAIY